MLGLGNGLFKNTINKKYALDYIPGGVENNVLWLSYYQMTGRRNDECFRLRDLTTSDEWDIGRVNGYVDYNRVLSLLSGNTGLATKIYNNTWAVGANDAIQTNVANMPIVCAGGVFNHDGFNFVAASSNYMQIVDYSAVKLTGPPMSIYQNVTVETTSQQGFVWERRGKMGTLIYSTQYSAFLNGAARLFVNLSGTLLKSVHNWQGTGTNEGLTKVNSTIINAQTYNASITTEDVDFNIGYGFAAYYFSGFIKTISMSTDNLYSYYNILAARC